MAMTMRTVGLDEVMNTLARLNADAEKVAAASLYDGAGIIADAFDNAARSIRTEPFTQKKAKRLPSPEEKAAIIGKTGIARFDKNGSEVNTLIGVSGAAGYANIGGKQKAVRLIARAINSGTSFMPKQPVFRKAKSASQGAAKAAIIGKAEEMLNEITKG